MVGGQRRSQPFCLAQRERQLADVIVAQREDVERIKLHLVIELAGTQPVEVGDAASRQSASSGVKLIGS